MDTARALKYLSESEAWSLEFRRAQKSEVLIKIIVDPLGQNATRSDNSIVWNPTLGVQTRAGDIQSPAVSLGHELDHVLRQASDRNGYITDRRTKTPTGDVNEDKATAASNAIARQLGEATQKDYTDVIREVPVEDVKFSKHGIEEPE